MHPTPSHRISLSILSFTWLLVNLVLFLKNGIKITVDSERYIGYANGLASGFYFDSHNFWYLGYEVYLLLMFKLFGGSVAAVVAGQYVLSFLAVLTLYRAAFLLWNSTTSALITCLLFLGFVDISTWNSYVLTESIYTSFICFSIYGLVVIHKKTASTAFIAITTAVVLFTIFIKPTGIALLVAVGSVAIYKLPWRGVVVPVAVVLLILLANRMLTSYKLIETYSAGEVISGVSTFSDQEVVKNLIVERPDGLVNPSSPYPVIRVLSFIFHNTIYWTKLFALKVYYLLIHTRPFWSAFHNLFSIAILLPSYFLFFRGLGVERSVVVFSAAYLLVHIFSIGLTADDWDGRFLIPMLPVIFIFSGHALEGYISKMKSKEAGV